ncbi:MAG: 2-oxoacid:ferredoxin oxidoreductase subunit beta [Acidobacteriaceae bacterium]|nr:2-oxoacid:ferredoxin oxidoreductase subunit beta [Acidobacteriaceae bacterium]MBV8572270.1 2-oxoacid:ferredoxin oxidoreductase subunit beta [Acidobacteriaceae bacterium]
MPSIAKPVVRHPSQQTNELGLTIRDYEGTMSTLCAGCGHDSITAAIVRALWEIAMPPHMLGKMSGIGCSSKTPAYFANGAHGFNSAHGRMPAIATGAAAANRDITYIGVSGDGDSLSIGLGHMCHAIRRNVRMVYVIENNGVYGLTKGQFSASADVGSKSKRGESNQFQPIDPVILALGLGATFVARGFSGDKEHLVPILRAAFAHRGLALVDVISPCVTFNDHSGSTKSYLYTRKNELKATAADFVPVREEIVTSIAEEGVTSIAMHDGNIVRFRSVPEGYDPTDRQRVMSFLLDKKNSSEIVTGLLFIDETVDNLHEQNNTSAVPLCQLPYEQLCPGARALDQLQDEFR